jgi:hypothetical protein
VVTLYQKNSFDLSSSTLDDQLERTKGQVLSGIRGVTIKVSPWCFKHASSSLRKAAIRHDAIISEENVDVFDTAGIKKADISILSDEFLAGIQGMKRQNLALELLKRLLNDEIRTRGKTNLIQGRKFSEMLADAVKRYQSGLIDSARMIDELIRLAKDIREADRRGEKMNLRADELAFYDALADNPTAEAVLGDYTLKLIAHELVEIVQKNTSIDWQVKESVQAKLRVLVKRILRKYKYPPTTRRQENTLSWLPRFWIRPACWPILGPVTRWNDISRASNHVMTFWHHGLGSCFHHQVLHRD